MRLEEMKNNIPETPDFIHKMVQEEVSRQLQDTKVVPMKKRKWNKVQAAAAAALCLLATSTVAYGRQQTVPYVCGKTGKLPCGDWDSGGCRNIRAAPGTDS